MPPGVHNQINAGYRTCDEQNKDRNTYFGYEPVSYGGYQHIGQHHGNHGGEAKAQSVNGASTDRQQWAQAQ